MEDRNLFFPLFINLKNKEILIIGAGKIAYRKAITLLKYGAKIKVVTKEIKEERFKELKNIEISIKEFSENMLESVFMVICATDNSEFNEKVYKLCDKKNILVNNITSKTEMNCRFGSVIDKEDCILGISAKGNPKKSKELREKLEKLL